MYFLIPNINVTDQNWVSDYAANVQKLAEKHGGKYRYRSCNVETAEDALGRNHRRFTFVGLYE